MTTPTLNCANRTVFIGDNREVMLGLNAEIADAIITTRPSTEPPLRTRILANQRKKGRKSPVLTTAWTMGGRKSLSF